MPMWSWPMIAILAVALAPAAAATAAPPGRGLGASPHAGDYNGGKPLPLRGSVRPPRAGRGTDDGSPRAAGSAPEVGTVRSWPAVDDHKDTTYMKDFTLRALGEHIEVWVANDLDFPSGDCRNGERTVVTDDQVRYLVREFDANI